MKLFMFYTVFAPPSGWIGIPRNSRAIYVYARSLSSAATLCEKELHEHEIFSQIQTLPLATMLVEQS